MIPWQPPLVLAPDSLDRLADAARRALLNWPDPDRISRQRLHKIRERELSRGGPRATGDKMPGAAKGGRPRKKIEGTKLAVDMLHGAR